MDATIGIVARSAGGATLRFDGRPEQVSLPARSAWILTVAGDGVWSPEQTVEPRSGITQHVDLTVYPAAMVRGTLEGAAAVTPRIALRIALDTGKILDAWCPVVEKRFGCWLPAGGSWVRIQPEGWVPQIRKLRLRPEQEVDLGRLRFARGGGVRGRVLLADNAPCPQCSIEIEPFTASEGGIRGAPAIERSLCVARSATDEHGSFRALGLAPGTYLLRATADGQVATDRTTVRDGPAVPMAPRALFQQPLATTPAAWCVPRALSRLCCVFARARAGVAHLAAGTGSEVGTAALAGSRMLAAGCLVASFFGALRTIDDWHASCSS